MFPRCRLRLATVTGPRLAIGPIPTFYKRLKEGKSLFLFSNFAGIFWTCEIPEAFMDIAIGEEAAEGVYNLSTGEPHSIKEIFDIVCDHLGLGKIEAPRGSCWRR